VRKEEEVGVRNMDGSIGERSHVSEVRQMPKLVKNQEATD
jgi:hypothetical protein